MKELGKFELAIVKRSAKNVKALRVKRAKLEKVINDAGVELESINAQIDLFEAPIVKMTGGYTSEQVLNQIEGVMEGIDPEAATEAEDTISMCEPIEQVTQDIPETPLGINLFGNTQTSENDPLPFEV